MNIMVNSTAKPSTQDLVKDFISYKLSRAGYEYGGRQHQTEAPTEVHRILRLVGDEFETAFFNSFEDMTASINVHTNDLKNIFDHILDVNFDTGIQWGRIVGVFVFAARLAVKAMTCERPDVVDNLCEWATNYLRQQRFANWINQSGGWEGFVQFYKNPQRSLEQEQSTWRKACSVGFTVLNGAASMFNTLMS